MLKIGAIYLLKKNKEILISECDSQGNFIGDVRKPLESLNEESKNKISQGLLFHSNTEKSAFLFPKGVEPNFNKIGTPINGFITSLDNIDSNLPYAYSWEEVDSVPLRFRAEAKNEPKKWTQSKIEDGDLDKYIVIQKPDGYHYIRLSKDFKDLSYGMKKMQIGNVRKQLTEKDVILNKI
jgi:hypothetical protein